MKIECIQNSPYYQSLTSTLSPYVKLFTEQVARIPHPSHIDRKLVASLAVPFCTAVVGLFVLRYLFSKPQKAHTSAFSSFQIDKTLSAKLERQMVAYNYLQNAEQRTQYRFELGGYQYTITTVDNKLRNTSPFIFHNIGHNAPYICPRIIDKGRFLFAAEHCTAVINSTKQLILRHKIADHPNLVPIKEGATEEAIRQIIRLFFTLGVTVFAEDQFMWDRNNQVLVMTTPPLNRNEQPVEPWRFVQELTKQLNDEQVSWLQSELEDINQSPPDFYKPGFLNNLFAILDAAKQQEKK